MCPHASREAKAGDARLLRIGEQHAIGVDVICSRVHSETPSSTVPCASANVAGTSIRFLPRRPDRDPENVHVLLQPTEMETQPA